MYVNITTNIITMRNFLRGYYGQSQEIPIHIPYWPFVMGG